MDNFCERATFIHDLHFKMFGKNLSLWIKVTARLYHTLFATIQVSTSVGNIYHHPNKAKWYIHPKFGITTDNIEGVIYYIYKRFNWCYQAVAFPLLACVTEFPQDFSLVNCLLNISDIIVQAMNALHGMDSYWKEVVGEYMKEWYKG